jgi:hypothetical protein
MKRWFVCLAMAALPLCGAQKGAQLPPITLFTRFSEPPPAAVLSALQAEVHAIMAPMGMTFQWRELSASNGEDVSVEIAVVDFQGRCNIDGRMARDTKPGPLGWTNVSDGAILPFAKVDCSAVRNFIQRGLLDRRADERAQAFGRALGRVLAHELYHIFANTARHGSFGVGRKFYSVHDLLTASFQFQARESMALINGKAHAALANAADADDPEHRD